MQKMNYWINVISKDHVLRGVSGGFTQAGHGKNTGLKRLKSGDWIVFYSPKTAYGNGDMLQAFTAIGQVKDEESYQVEMTADIHPWRRNVAFRKCEEVPIKPLIDDLSFIKDKTHWGYIFRFGLFQIPEGDFRLIERLMIA
jgi:predicted RNA-binding protein